MKLNIRFYYYWYTDSVISLSIVYSSTVYSTYCLRCMGLWRLGGWAAKTMEPDGACHRRVADSLLCAPLPTGEASHLDWERDREVLAQPSGDQGEGTGYTWLAMRAATPQQPRATSQSQRAPAGCCNDGGCHRRADKGTLTVHRSIYLVSALWMGGGGGRWRILLCMKYRIKQYIHVRNT